MWSFACVLSGVTMNEKERVLQMALILMKHGEPLPVDLLARADALGIDVEELDQPHQHNFNNNDKE